MSEQPKFNVFLSWSGPLSHGVAEIFHQELKDLIPGTVPWISSDNIPSGKPWFASIVGQLSQSPEGIFFITKQNRKSPWLFYEAGAIAVGSPDASNCVYLIGVQPHEMSGTPLGQTQMRAFTEEDTWKLVRDVNNRLPTVNNENLLRTKFDKEWPKIRKRIEKLIQENPPAEETEDDIADQLSQEAQQLLIEASQARGTFTSSNTMHGYSVQMHKKELVNTKDRRVESRWKAAIEELEVHGYIEDRAGKGEVFFLKEPGFKLGDVLGQTSNPQESEPPPSDADLKNMLHAWFTSKGYKNTGFVESTHVITFADADAEAKVPTGTTKRLLEEVVKGHEFLVEEQGDHTARIRTIPVEGVAVTRRRG